MADAKKRGSRNDKPYRRPRKKVCNFCVDKIDKEKLQLLFKEQDILHFYHIQ